MLTSLIASVSRPEVVIVAALLMLLFGVVLALTHSSGRALRCRCGSDATQFDGRSGKALCDDCITALETARAARRR
jgi:hypothetical protein